MPASSPRASEAPREAEAELLRRREAETKAERAAGSGRRSSHGPCPSSSSSSSTSLSTSVAALGRPPTTALARGDARAPLLPCRRPPARHRRLYMLPVATLSPPRHPRSSASAAGRPRRLRLCLSRPSPPSSSSSSTSSSYTVPPPPPAVCLCAPITVDAWLAAVEPRQGRAWPTEAAEARLASGGGGAACGPRRRWSRAQPAETAKPRGAGRRAEEALAAGPCAAGGGGSARGERRRWSARGRRRCLLPRREEAGRREGIERR
uniref:Uncharacterized protein n=1 Tax=Oryza sativa subsp. japonica TaxID=39947 RepID=Q84QM5_ORYSJ|nr:hypothetical protein [Oryza sativa Japonica Group]BAD01245.1 hypothetical protein [Oryza sativa Japonica Group]